MGPPFMHHLENVHVASDRDLIDARFPVQYVVRPKSDAHHDYRGFGGQVADGVLKPGDEVVVLPSGMTSTIEGIDLFDTEVPEAFPPMSVTVRLTDDVDVSRGDMIARVNNAPKPSQDIDAMVRWMTTAPLKPRQKLAIKHTTRTGRALVKDIHYRLDVNTLHRDQETKELGVNEIGRVQLRTTVPLLADPYSKNRTTGSFILIDEATGVTVSAGLTPRSDGHIQENEPRRLRPRRSWRAIDTRPRRRSGRCLRCRTLRDVAPDPVPDRSLDELVTGSGQRERQHELDGHPGKNGGDHLAGEEDDRKVPEI